MKIDLKKLIAIGMGTIFLMTGTVTSDDTTSKTLTYAIENDIRTTDTPPEWAMGNFTGTYGTLVHGESATKLGKIEGYWASNVFISNRFQKGRIEGQFYENGLSIPTSKLTVSSFSVYTSTHLRTFIIGKITDYAQNKSTRCFGMGNCWFNYTLDYKIYLHFKESLYFSGNWSLFEE